MNDQILTSLSIITSFHNEGESILNAFLPLVEYGIATLKVEKDNKHCDIETLQEKINNSSGIKINILSLKSLLKKLRNDGMLNLFDHAKYFEIIEEKRPTQDEYLVSVNKHYTNIYVYNAI